MEKLRINKFPGFVFCAKNSSKLKGYGNENGMQRQPESKYTHYIKGAFVSSSRINSETLSSRIIHLQIGTLSGVSLLLD